MRKPRTFTQEQAERVRGALRRFVDRYGYGGLDITGSVGVAVALAIASLYKVIGCDPVVVPLVERMKIGRPFAANIELVTDPAVAVAVADAVIVCLDTHENRAAVDAGSAYKTVPVLNLDFRR